jgi:hypothetical protein
MSGQISVQSTKGEGSVFTLTFRRFVESERLSGLEAGGDGIPAVSQLF